jgi:type IV pilus assembly protein PilA
MLQRLRHRAQGQEGFTLIELLVVILIIGILAAVAIPAFLSQKGKAYDANVKSAINSAQTAEETYNTSNSTYVAAAAAAAPTAATNPLVNVEPTLTAPFTSPAAANGHDAMAATAPPAPATLTTGYTITATDGSVTPVEVYKLVSVSGTVTRTCTPLGGNGCSAAGTW